MKIKDADLRESIVDRYICEGGKDEDGEYSSVKEFLADLKNDIKLLEGWENAATSIAYLKLLYKYGQQIKKVDDIEFLLYAFEAGNEALGLFEKYLKEGPKALKELEEYLDERDE